MSDASSDSHDDANSDDELFYYRKPCVRASTLANVPDQTWVRIFAHVDAIQVARIQRVSRQWNRIIRSTPAVWRNALYLDYGLRLWSLPTLSFRLHKLATLSERKLDKMGLFIEGFSSCSDNWGCACSSFTSTLHWLFVLLRELSVGVLYVFIEECSGCQDYYRDTLFRNLEQMSYTNFESLVICLRNTIIGTDRDRRKDHSTSLLDAVGLSDDIKHRLYLDRITFPGGVELSVKIFANLTGLHIESLRFEYKGGVQALWTLLQSVQNTLHELFLNLTASALPFAENLGSDSETSTTLTFTKLVRFHLGYEGSSQDDFPGPQLYDFSCPVLESLSLNCQMSRVLFDGLLTQTVKYVRVTCETLVYEQNVKALIEKQGIRKLFIDGREMDNLHKDDWHRAILSALRIQPQEFFLVFDYAPSRYSILMFAEHVASIYPSYSKPPQVGFCCVTRHHTCRQIQLDDLRESVPNADQYICMENARLYFAMHEQTWGKYEIGWEL